MTDINKEILSALLGAYVDKFTPVELNRLIASLPADFQGWLYQAIKKYPADVDLTQLVQDANTPHRKASWTADELMATKFPDLAWIVPNIIPAGLVSLAGRPKIGKSWMALQMAIAVASGGYFLGEKCEKQGVLYITFEDPGRRLKERIQKIGASPGMDLQFEADWPMLNDGGLDDLQVAADSERYKLIVVDTFGRSIGLIEIKDYAANVTALSPLQKMANSENITILLIDHHGKINQFEDNPTKDLIGSIGKAGTFDSIIGLYRDKKRGAKIMITGREYGEKELALKWDLMTCSWQLIGEVSAVRADTLKGNILQAIRELVEIGELPTTTRIAKHLDENTGNVGHAIGELLNNGQLAKGPKVGREQPYDVIQ